MPAARPFRSVNAIWRFNLETSHTSGKSSAWDFYKNVFEQLVEL